MKYTPEYIDFVKFRICGDGLPDAEITVKPNCASTGPDGSPKCALREKVDSAEGADEVARQMLAAFRAQDKDLLPAEFYNERGVNASGEVCDHANRMAAWCINSYMDNGGEVTGLEFLGLTEWLIALGLGKRASVEQRLPSDGTVVYVRTLRD